MFELRGNLHVHSSRSDGTMDLNGISRCASEANLDFVGINDHHVECEPHRYVNGVLFLLGSEYNRQHSHILAYNVAQGPGRGQFAGRELVELVNRHKGMGIIAHPFEKGSPYFSRGRAYRWQDWQAGCYQGIEVWNATSQWKESTARLLRSLWLLLVDPYRPIYVGPCKEALARWDKETRKRHVTGVAGSDAHAPGIRLGPFRFAVLDYPMLFRAVNNYVLLGQRLSGQGEVDGNMVLGALARGRCWFALDRLGLAHGFRYWACGRSRRGMGDTVQLSGRGAELEVYSPEDGLIRLFHNGRELAAGSGRHLGWRAKEPGAYRAEVWKQRRREDLPWIFSNPIYLK